jgi:hypothetical protein
MSTPVETTPETAAVVPSPADMPPTQTPVAAAPTTETPEPSADTDQAKPSLEEKELARARKDAANYRERLRLSEESVAAATKSAQEKDTETASLKDMLAKLAAVLNPEADTPPDPAKLAEQLTAAQAETARVAAEKDQMIRNLSIRAALPNALAKVSADPALTEAVLTASGALAKLDPSADTFTADLELAVAAAMDANPRLKIDAPVAQSRKSGAEIPGRSGGSDQLTIEQVRAMKPEQIEEARKAGKLRTLLGG